MIYHTVNKKIYRDDFIQSIKDFRAIFFLGLKEAKDAVENMRYGNIPYEVDFELSPKQITELKSCGFTVTTVSNLPDDLFHVYIKEKEFTYINNTLTIKSDDMTISITLTENEKNALFSALGIAGPAYC